MHRRPEEFKLTSPEDGKKERRKKYPKEEDIRKPLVDLKALEMLQDERPKPSDTSETPTIETDDDDDTKDDQWTSLGYM